MDNQDPEVKEQAQEAEQEVVNGNDAGAANEEEGDDAGQE